MIALSPAINLGVPCDCNCFCDVQFYVEMLNGFLQWFAEKEILGFKDE